MNKFVLITLLTFWLANSKAEIITDINKHGIMFVHFIYDDYQPTIKMFHSDWETAINIAIKNTKVKQIQFKDTNKATIAWIEKPQFYNWETVFHKIVNDFSSFDKTETVYGDSILRHRKYPAKYHKDTYKNGKLISQFVSDWNGGEFKPSRSEFITGDDRFVSKTYVTPARTEGYWEKPIIGNRIIEKGETVRLKEIYSKSKE